MIKPLNNWNKRLLPLFAPAILASAILAGCTEEAADGTETSPEDVSEEEPSESQEPETAENAEPSETQEPDTADEEEAMPESAEPAQDAPADLGAPYDQLEEFIAAYELPAEGRVPTEDDAYSVFPNPNAVVIYENGYTFDAETRRLIMIKYNEDGEKPEPAPGQETGVVLGAIADAMATPNLDEVLTGTDVAYVTGRLEEAKALNDFEPLEVWLTARIEELQSAGALEDGDGKDAALADIQAHFDSFNSIWRQ
ncbi:hypothetical protein [Indiicoccus explosivorum]|uniref:hypothetical protein n=1 Tax=Indiicoccus explosivorum TaxID=1917864 RepID=UPI000B43EFCE|nr:hypothetical protein [Indiicoccus explosivorum]